ncbi:MAG: hypothetical protein R3228_19135 [Halioglobus sp.]|nr:hypothetical protein [Halioglobus sp.]
MIHRFSLFALLSLLATGCAVQPGEEAAVQRFVEQQKRVASALRDQGRLAESLAVWRSIEPLGADAAASAAINDLVIAIDKAVTGNLRRGRRAYSAGNTRRGDDYMLRILALQPGHDEALRRLRESATARARAQRARLAPQRYATPTPAPAATSGGRDTTSTLEALARKGDHAAIVALEAGIDAGANPRQGEILRSARVALANQAEARGQEEEALQHLLAAIMVMPVQSDPLLERSAALRRSLSTRWYQEGSRLIKSDLDAAVGALEKSLAFNPYNTNAKRKLTQAQTLQRNLRKISAPP